MSHYVVLAGLELTIYLDLLFVKLNLVSQEEETKLKQYF